MHSPFWIFALWVVLFVHNAAAEESRSVPNISLKGRFYTLLSLDAGGLRLHMTNQILKEVEKLIREHLYSHPELRPESAKTATSPEEIQVFLADYFALISGISGGSWVGLYYASKGGNGAAAKVFNKPEIIKKYGHLVPGSAAGLDVFFEEYGKKIYPPGICSVQLPRLQMQRFCLGVCIPGVTCPLYPVKGLEETLKDFYGDTKLSQLHTSVLVSAFDVHRRDPVLFVFDKQATESFSAAIIVQSYDTIVLNDTDQLLRGQRRLPSQERYQEVRRDDFFIRDLGRASSAAPGFHAAKIFHAIGNETESFECVDGALVGPSPTMPGMNFMLHMEGISEIDRVATLSLGSGTVIGDYGFDPGNPWRWLLSGDLINIVVDGGSEFVHSNLHYMFYNQLNVKEGQFQRVQVLANETSKYRDALDGFTHVDQLDNLKKIGVLVAEDFKDALKHFVENFIFGNVEEDEEAPPI